MSKESNDFLEFKCSKSELWIRLKKDALDLIFAECLSSGDIEVGGIMTGHYANSGVTCTITDLHLPTDDSKRGKTIFESGIAGLSKILKKLWKNNQYYVGEWHFHPQNSPTPSSQDKKQLKDISSTKKLHCKFPLMLIVGQREDDFYISLTGYGKNCGFVSFQKS